MQPATLQPLPDDFGDTLFTANSPVDWSVVVFDDVLVLHHKLSNDIHLLNFIAQGLLSLLEQTDLTADEAARRFRENQGISEADCPLALVHRTLNDLDKAGLIRPFKRI